MKDRVLIVSVGQAGGNIGQELEKKGLLVHYINTSKKDLDSIESQSKYKVPMAKGCYGDRKLALSYAKKYFEQIASQIEDSYDTQDQVFFVGSFGGGTGSGLIPPLLDILSRRNPSKNYGAIMIYPGMNEDISARQNTSEAFKQLTNRPLLKNLYLLDNNNNKDKFKINEIFANTFMTFLNSSVPNKKGIIDEAEMEKLFSTRGSVFMTLVEDDINNNDEEFKRLNKALINSIDINVFTRQENACKYIAISSNIDFDNKAIEEKLGKPLRYFRGYNDGSYNLVAAFGMNFPLNRIEIINESIENEKDLILNDINQINYEVPTLHINKEKKGVYLESLEDINYDSIFDDLD